LAKTLAAKYSADANVAELAVEIAMARLQLEISDHVTGFVHVQTNPYHSYDTEKIVKGARSKLDVILH
jgi:transaldolase